MLAERIRARLVGAANVSVELVASIEPGSDGKFRVTRSLVRSAYDSVDWNLVLPGRAVLAPVRAGA